MQVKERPPLIMADGRKVRNSLDELREHFDEAKAIEQFKSGALWDWLDSRYYETLADSIRELMEEYEQRLDYEKRAMAEEQEAFEELGKRLGEAKELLKQHPDGAIAEKIAALEQEYESIKSMLPKIAKEDTGDARSALASRLADKKRELDDEHLGERLRKVLGVIPAAEKQRISEREEEKRKRLQAQTDDETILSHAALTAFTQEDMAELLDAGEKTIYLCGKEFEIPVRMEHMSYVGILGTPIAHIAAATAYDIKRLGISFSNISIDYLEDEMENFLSSIQSVMRRGLGEDVDPEFLILEETSGGKNAIRASIHQAAEEAENRLIETMATHIDRRLNRLDDLQAQYERICTERGLSPQKIKPALEEVHKALSEGHMRIIQEMAGRLAKKLISKASYEMLHFDLLRGSSYMLDNANDLDDVSDRIQHKYIAKYQKQDMEGMVQSYLHALRRAADKLDELCEKKEGNSITA